MLKPYDWDEAKRAANLAERGIDFAAAYDFDWDNATVVPSDRGGEARFIAFGYIDSRLYAIVFTWRGSVRRIISFRKANPREVHRYG